MEHDDIMEERQPLKTWGEADKVSLITEQQRMNHVTEHILEKEEKEVTDIIYIHTSENVQ